MASERAAGALANLGRGPSWVAGKQNRESAQVEGKDFQDLE